MQAVSATSRASATASSQEVEGGAWLLQVMANVGSIPRAAEGSHRWRSSPQPRYSLFAPLHPNEGAARRLASSGGEVVSLNKPRLRRVGPETGQVIEVGERDQAADCCISDPSSRH